MIESYFLPFCRRQTTNQRSGLFIHTPALIYSSVKCTGAPKYPYKKDIYFGAPVHFTDE